MGPPRDSARSGGLAGALLVCQHIIYIVGMTTPSPVVKTLSERTVLITGAAGGIGAAAARRLAAEGARLGLADLDGAAVEKLAAELGGVGVRADVTREADIAAMVDEPYRRWG